MGESQEQARDDTRVIRASVSRKSTLALQFVQMASVCADAIATLTDPDGPFAGGAQPGEALSFADRTDVTGLALAIRSTADTAARIVARG